MYKIINEDNSLVTDYPSNVLYNLLKEEEKEFIFFFKKEMDRITEKIGLGKITVSVTYDSDIIEKVFEIKNMISIEFEKREKIIDKIISHMIEFCKKNNIYEYYRFVYIIAN
ncbi:hypothetical protein [Methanobrevibacter sp.]|uniref:hypothetical protein n=1 Tax=Methanobrevibacter sp. TaxID=66852 RepID=UPI001AFEBDBF|nr:hypothetical protein [Methanobrevibacter sp.]